MKGKQKQKRGIKIVPKPVFEDVPCAYSVTGTRRELKRVEWANPEEVAVQYEEALSEVAAEFNRPREEVQGLALEIALKYHPALQMYFHKPGGKPRVWNMMRAFFLWYDVQALKQKRPTLSVSAACEILSKRPEWKPFKGKALAEAYSRYAEKSPMTKMMQNALRVIDWDRLRDAMAELAADRSDIYEHIRKVEQNPLL